MPDEAAWRASFVRAMNHAAMKRVAEARASKLERMARGEGSECDAASVAPSDAKWVDRIV